MRSPRRRWSAEPLAQAAGDDNFDGPETPVQARVKGSVERHPQGTRAGQLGDRRIAVGKQRVAALPDDQRWQPQRQVRADRERQKRVAQERREVGGEQILQLDAVLGRQAEPQEAEG